MTIRYGIKIALRSLQVHRGRSLLTILGIVIGITAIFMVMALGSGAQGLIVGELGGLGAETLVVRPGKEPTGPTDFADIFFSDSLKERELEALKRKINVPDLADISPEVVVPGGVSYGGEMFKKGLVLGFSADFFANNFKSRLAEGEAFTDADIRARASVAIIGSEVRRELFGTAPAVGEFITIKGRKFKVVGVYEPQGQVVFFNIDEVTLVPYTTAQTYLTGANHYTQIIVKAKDAALVERVKSDIILTLRELHRTTGPENDDFNVQTQQGLVAQVSSIIGVFTLFLSFVVAISLIVGGIGVMNIMLVSVTERTREIGLRKAVGARNRDIMRQFLFEAIILTLVGGVIGILLGSALTVVATLGIKIFTSFNVPFVFPLGAVILGLVVSAGVGLIFGLYPARQAAAKSPIEALRYE